MKHYYATGNGGNGTQIYAFESQKERNDFVAWNTRFNQRGKVNRDQARKYNTLAILLMDGQIVPDGHGPIQLTI